MRESEASWQTSAALRRIRSLLLANVVEEKLRNLERAVKANFNPDEPRVPRGNRGGGQWTSTGGPQASQGAGPGSNEAPRGAQLASSTGGPIGDPPKVPKERPPSPRVRARIYKQLAVWALNLTVRKRIAFLVSLLDEAGWLDPIIDSIHTFADPPKSLEELQRDVSNPAPGYDIHHIVEQTSAEEDGFPRSRIDAPGNLVRVPRLKHWLITGWYMKKSLAYGDLSPRAFLRGKSWEERQQIGLEALIRFGVLKP